MRSGDDILIMTRFPDFYASCFDMNAYNKTFEEKNVIIHASSTDVAYPEHWGPLSVKSVVKGTEYYKCNTRFYSVDADSYLVFNNGQYYSSYIYSDVETESFTVNFSPAFLWTVVQGLAGKFEDEDEKNNFEFIEKLYRFDNAVTPLLRKLYKASIARDPDVQLMNETYYTLLENLLLHQSAVKKEIKTVKAQKYSTQIELYKRLNYAKDFIYSCYMHEITLNKLASVVCMNSAYFLREFKKYFGSTPHQCIMHRRLEAAKNLLETTSSNIAEICYSVGYSDVTSFNKLFRKNFSVTPAAYRLMKTKKSFFTC